MKANHRELLGLSFNGRLKNYFNDDFEYHDYNVGDLIDMPNDEIMVAIKDNRNKINEIIKRLNGE